MENGQATLLTAPRPELEALSFAHPEPESVGEWIGRLPMANASETAGQIRQATFEITRLDTDWSTRMALLEGIRPTVLYLSARLDKAATGGGTQSDGISRLAQRLQTNLCSGYKAVALAARDLVPTEPEAARAVSLAIHRAISDLSRTLLRTLQFYVAPADRLWLKLNQLYLLAEQLGLDAELHADTGNDSGLELSTASAYTRSLLLALARPYQLRHSQLNIIFEALGYWAHMVSLSDAIDEDLYRVDLGSDQGPGYAASFQKDQLIRGIRSEVLVHELEAHLQEQECSIVIPGSLDLSLINHLAGAWGEMKTREFSRSGSTSLIKVCVGIRATHYYLSGAVEFTPATGSGNDDSPREINPFLNDNVRFVPNAGEAPADVWEGAFDVGAKIPENPNIADPDTVLYAHEPAQRADPTTSYQSFDTTAVDMSPGGYRLRWNEPFPAALQSGELIGLRNESDPRWCIGITRWIRKDESGPFIGVELLAPRATPVATRLVQSKGSHSEYQRAFLLPELKPVGRPATLITPGAPFQAGQKIHLIKDGRQSTVQLGECLLKTGSFNQFTFRVLDGYLEKAESQLNMIDPVTFNNNQQTGSR